LGDLIFFTLGRRIGIRKGKALAVKAIRQLRKELDEIEAHEYNAVKAAKFRQRTLEADPDRKATVSKARLRAIIYRNPDPRK
jgi:hypothetical protein